jgi:AcrR family transcriptional regulator
LSKRLSADERREVIELAATEVFAERGYGGASVDEIARRSGVSAPVVYDHFASKAELHRRLLERHRDELVAVWREHLLTDEPPERRIPRAIDAWARYVEAHPYAWKMLFRETSGDREAEAVHREVLAGSRALLAPLVSAQPGGAGLPHAEMAAELIRSALTGLALWWQDHPDVPRSDIVSTAVNVLWVGFERLGRGERWTS